MGINFKESGDTIVAEKDGSGNWVLYNQTDDSTTNPLLKIDENTGEVTVYHGDLDLNVGNLLNLQFVQNSAQSSPPTSPSNGDYYMDDGTNTGDGNAGLRQYTNGAWEDVGAGGGGVSGPASSTDNAIARWNGTGGDTLQDSIPTIDDSGNINVQGNSINNVLTLNNFVFVSQYPGNDVIDKLNSAMADVEPATYILPPGLKNLTTNRVLELSQPGNVFLGHGPHNSVIDTGSYTLEVRDTSGGFPYARDWLFANLGIAGNGGTDNLFLNADTTSYGHLRQGRFNNCRFTGTVTNQVHLEGNVYMASFVDSWFYDTCTNHILITDNNGQPSQLSARWCNFAQGTTAVKLNNSTYYPEFKIEGGTCNQLTNIFELTGRGQPTLKANHIENVDRGIYINGGGPGAMKIISIHSFTIANIDGTPFDSEVWGLINGGNRANWNDKTAVDDLEWYDDTNPNSGDYTTDASGQVSIDFLLNDTMFNHKPSLDVAIEGVAKSWDATWSTDVGNHYTDVTLTFYDSAGAAVGSGIAVHINVKGQGSGLMALE